MLPCPKIVRGQQRLTPEQVAYAREFARERIVAMLSTSSIDEQEAEAHLREAYQAAELQPPARIRWFDSPLAFLWTGVEKEHRWEDEWDQWGWMRLWEKIRESAGTDMCQEVRANVEVSVESSVWRVSGPLLYNPGPSIWIGALPGVQKGMVARALEKAKQGVRPDVWQSTIANVRANVKTDIWQSAREDTDMLKALGVTTGVEEGVRTLVKAVEKTNLHLRETEILKDYNNACHFAFYRFFHEVFEEHALIHLARFNELVSSYWLGEKEAWLVRKPVRLHRDKRGCFHNATGPCVQYQDGWGWYAWHGVYVPEKLILSPEQVTREEWVQERNVEVRRAIQERLGSERFIQLVGGICIHKNRRGKLIQIKLGVRDPDLVAHYVQVRDSSTSRHYYLRVPPWINSVDEAIAWTFGLSARDYQPGQKT